MSDIDTSLLVLQNGKPIIQLLADNGQITAGNAGIAGELRLANGENHGVIFLQAARALISTGNAGLAGKIRVQDANNVETIGLDAETAQISIGRKGLAGKIRVADANGNGAIFLDGNTGDITFTNADCAEEFDVAEDILVEPGMVMVLNGTGALALCDHAYDKRVAGVLSGAGNYKPGIVLDRQPSPHKRMALAMVGKVYCKVDAQYGAIEVGDLLTTSPTPGHAMRADDPMRAFGSVIGKALKSLNAGIGLVPLLVALQ